MRSYDQVQLVGCQESLRIQDSSLQTQAGYSANTVIPGRTLPAVAGNHVACLPACEAFNSVETGQLKPK